MATLQKVKWDSTNDAILVNNVRACRDYEAIANLFDCEPEECRSRFYWLCLNPHRLVNKSDRDYVLNFYRPIIEKAKKDGERNGVSDIKAEIASQFYWDEDTQAVLPRSSKAGEICFSSMFDDNTLGLPLTMSGIKIYCDNRGGEYDSRYVEISAQLLKINHVEQIATYEVD